MTSNRRDRPTARDARYPSVGAPAGANRTPKACASAATPASRFAPAGAPTETATRPGPPGGAAAAANGAVRRPRRRKEPGRRFRACRRSCMERSASAATHASRFAPAGAPTETATRPGPPAGAAAAATGAVRRPRRRTAPGRRCRAGRRSSLERSASAAIHASRVAPARAPTQTATRPGPPVGAAAAANGAVRRPRRRKEPGRRFRACRRSYMERSASAQTTSLLRSSLLVQVLERLCR